MKKIVSIVLALTMIAAAAMIFSGCGKDKSKSKKDATSATTATSAANADTPTSELSTLSGDTLETLAPQGGDNTSAEEQQSPTNSQQDYYNEYGGLSGQDAILKALDAVGAGYQCVSYDKAYLHNQEAWYIGVQATDGSDPTVYYLYVNSERCIPVTEIPNIGGNNSQDSGVFENSFAGISEQEAIFKAVGQMEDEYSCVSSEQTTSGGEEYWLIGIQKIGDPSADILYFYVNSSSCFQQ